MEKRKSSTPHGKTPTWMPKLVKGLWIAFGAGIVAITILILLIANGYVGYMPPIEELENPKNKFASEILSSDMKELGRYYQSKENRIGVNYQDLSPYIVQALISTEDVRFTSHSGIDVRALLRAFVKRGLLFQKSAGGGSTITQQLAKQLFSPSAESFMERVFQKPIEWVIAVQLERFYTKEEIINMYLNKFDFLNNAVGIQSAASVYFDKAPADLTVEEAAMLVGMCKNPSYFNPVRRVERTQGRRNTVLNQMRKADYITRATCDSLSALPLNLNFRKVDHKQGLAPYFREYLRQTLSAKKPVRSNYGSWQAEKFVEDSLSWENNPLYGWINKNEKPDGSRYNLYTDGLKIYTTIDSRMQQYAEEAVMEHVAQYLQPRFFKEKKGRSYAPFSKLVGEAEIDGIMKRAMKQSERYLIMQSAGVSETEIERVFNTPIEMQVFSWNGDIDTTMTPLDSIRYQKYFLRAGFMAMDPRNGHVKAYVGGPNFANFQYDMVTTGRRQVGSTIKPYLYTLAMQEGFTPCDLAPNVQPSIIDESGNLWEPRNAGNSRVGEMVTLEWGLANSNNWISAYLMKQLSPYAFVRLLHSFGLQGYIDPVISLCLGPADVSVAEMVTGYSAFANKGIRVDPLYVTRIEDNMGNVIAEFTPKMKEVIGEEAYYRMLPMLRKVIDGGTGVRIRYKYGIKAPMGGKTGTTNNNSDGWFMGFTPSLVAGTWVGGEDRSVHFDYTADGQGASMALPVMGLFLQKVYADSTLPYKETEDFTVPDQYRNPCAENSSTGVPTAPDKPQTMDDLFN